MLCLRNQLSEYSIVLYSIVKYSMAWGSIVDPKTFFPVIKASILDAWLPADGPGAERIVFTQSFRCDPADSRILSGLKSPPVLFWCSLQKL